MRKSKLYSAINSLSNREKRAFSKFIKSPYFNDNQTLVVLFELLVLEGAPEKYEIWQKIRPGTPFNDVFLRRLGSDLIKLVNEFVAIEIYKKSPVIKNNELLKYYNGKNLDKHFWGIEKIQRQQMESSVYRNSDYYFNRLNLEQEVDDNRVKSIQLTKQVNLEEVDKMLDCFYLSKKLKNYCNVLNYKNVLNLEISQLVSDEIFSLVFENEELQEIPAIGIYFKIACTLVYPEDERYLDQLVELLDKHGLVFPILELRDMYIFAQNYCIKKINIGKQVYFEKLFRIYQVILEKEIIYKNGQLLPWDYKNIVSLGLRLKEFDFIEAFIETQNQFLPVDFQSNAVIYNKANLHFHKKNYQQVIELLREVKYQDLYYELDCRWLLLKTYFELDELEAMTSLLESFRLYLIRNKLLSKRNQRQYLNLVKFSKKLIRLSLKKDKMIHKLRAQIVESKEVAERKWLLEKIGEFEISL